MRVLFTPCKLLYEVEPALVKLVKMADLGLAVACQGYEPGLFHRFETDLHLGEDESLSQAVLDRKCRQNDCLSGQATKGTAANQQSTVSQIASQQSEDY